MLPPEAIKEYQELYFRNYDVQLSDAEAALGANNLVNLYKAVFIDDPKTIKDEQQSDTK